MGLIRFLLAISVVASHIPNIPPSLLMMHHGTSQMFFIISGFYMAMVYNNYKSKYDFWISRYFRLYPLYFACLMIEFINFPLYVYIEQLIKQPWETIVVLCFSELTMFFRDILFMLSYDNGSLSLVTPSLKASTAHLHLLPVTWSLGIELSFYLMVPYIINNISRLNILFITCITFGFWINYQYHWFENIGGPFQFFPTALPLFIWGIYIYKYSAQIFDYTKKIHPIILILTNIIYLFVFKMLPLPLYVKLIIFYLLFAFSIPSIFNYTKKLKWDRAIGQLSYPIYLIHITVIYNITPYFKRMLNIVPPTNPMNEMLARCKVPIPPTETIATTLLHFFLSIFCAIILHIVIAKPFEELRKKFKNKHKLKTQNA